MKGVIVIPCKYYEMFTATDAEYDEDPDGNGYYYPVEYPIGDGCHLKEEYSPNCEGCELYEEREAY
jgi:hypothetical protein